MKFGLTIRIVLSILITVLAIVYQRKTGPTYPIEGAVALKDLNIEYRLLRSHGGKRDQPVEITVPDTSYKAFVVFRRFKADEPWKMMKMHRNEARLIAALPHQPPAGKIEYYIIITDAENYTTVPQNQTVVTRFKGHVPTGVLIPHVLFMFCAMLLSTLAGLEALANGKYIYRFALWTTILLFVGGMVLGPIVQKLAFGQLWTGFPFGMDLTDNKTLIAMLAWLFALWQGRKGRSARAWVIIAAVVLLAVYSIPHSLMGSELNYETMRVETGN
jgi:hypothetical protein